jgi:predicted site-specific integrase-resolvase
MNLTPIGLSEGRRTLPKLIREVDENGKIYVFTIHGKAKVAMVDLDLLEEFIENTEYGISEKELSERSKEDTISLDDLKEELNA